MHEMNIEKVEYLSSGDTALTVQFGTEINAQLNNMVLQLHRYVMAAGINGILETVPTYRSLLVHYDPLILSQGRLITALNSLMEKLESPSDNALVDSTEAQINHWQFPICFDEEFAPDLPFVSDALGRTAETIINSFLKVTHHVYMLGFAPGQPYMGGLPKELSIPRRENPIPRIHEGSLVTATGMTIIYSVANPTGWHIIGRTPIRLFDINRKPAILLNPGDQVRLTAVSRQDYEQILYQVQDGSFDVNRLKLS